MKSDLHELIHSLSKNEKRYFRIEATKHKNKADNNSLILYEILSKQEEYDEIQLVAQLQEEAPNVLKRFSAVKSYLYNLILKSLSSYYEERSSQLKCAKLLQRVEILYIKGLYKQAKKVLNQAHKIATQNHLDAHLLLIFQWGTELAFLDNKYQKVQKEIDQIERDQEKVMERIQNDFVYRGVYRKTYNYIFQYGIPRTQSERRDFIDATHIAEDIGPPQSLYAQDSYHFIRSTYAYFLGDIEQALVESKARMEVYEKHPQLIIDRPYKYMKGVYNYVQVLLSLKEPDISQALLYIQKVRDLEKQPKIYLGDRSKHLLFLLVYNHLVNIYMDQGEFDTAIRLGETLKKELAQKTYSGKNENHFFVYFRLSFCALLEEDYDNAIYWVQEILNDKSISIRYDILCYVRILHFIIHYELGNFTLLPALIDSAIRFMMECNKWQAPEQLLMGLCRKLANNGKKSSQVQRALEKTKKILIELMDNPDFSTAYIKEYYVLEWIESLQKQVPYKQVILNALKN